MEIKLHSFFVLSLPSQLMETFFTAIFNFNEFILYVVNIRFICDGKIYLLNMLKSIKKSEKGKLQAKCLLTFLPDTHKEMFCMSLLKDVREHSWMSHNVSFRSFAGKACVRYFLSIFYFSIK